MKTCSKCGVEKEPSEFYLSPRGKPVAECKVCAKARSRASVLANPERVAENRKRFHEAHPEKAAGYAKKYNAQPEVAVVRRARQNAWRKANPEKRAAIESRQRAANPEKYKVKKAKYYAKYREEILAKAAERAKASPEKKVAADARYYRAHPEKWVGRPAWSKKYPERHAAKQGKRRAHKAQATPAWANEFFMAEAYELAKIRTKTFGFKWEVDHIVPLKSAVVCGLHVETNLQVIPAVENRSKSNRYWPDMPAAQRTP